MPAPCYPVILLAVTHARKKPGQRLARIKTNLAREASKFARKLLAPPGMREAPPAYPQDFSPFSKHLCKQVNPYTMTSKERVVNLEYATRHIVEHLIEGDFVECGVGRGGSMMAAAYTLLELGVTDRKLYLYDTYTGMARPTEEDVSFLGKRATDKYEKKLKNGVSTWNNVPIEEVRENVGRTGYPPDNFELIAGLVQETLPDNAIQKIALLRLDTNLYESTQAELRFLFPKLSGGGVLIVDDYNKWLGQRKAVDEYFKEHGVRMLLTRVDDHSVMGVKSY